MPGRSMLPDVGGLISGGESASKAAWTVALGFAIGMFPLMGITTITCVLLAGMFRLRQAPMQLGNYAALPLQILLILPFLRIGERITGAERFVFDPPALLKGFPHIPESTARAVLMAQWHMIVGWAVVAPIALILTVVVVRALLRRRESAEVTVLRRPA